MKTVLAYSGGLDTSFIIKRLQEHYKSEVITFTLELGQGDSDLKEIEEKAKRLGAVKTYSVDARPEFIEGYVNPAIKANALYQGKYPVSTAIGRPLITKHLVEIADKEGADAVAHGCTAKGNDQVRFDVTTMALAPELKIIAPVREHPMDRPTLIDYAKKHGIEVPITKKSPYSIDENLWGRSNECGILEDPWAEPPADAYHWTVDPRDAPDEPDYVEIEFEKGVPVGLNGERISELDIIYRLNELGGNHGIGRVDHVEDRLVGIKSREIYECPAATIIITAHKDLENLTLTREQVLFKSHMDAKWSEMAYFGQWYDPLFSSINAFIDNTQEVVTGTVRVKLFKGVATVVGRKSPNSLYDTGLATYDKDDTYDHAAAEGFIKLWGLPSKVAGIRSRK
jgi:argininosuccinate synthase